jgi:hypothetical protein
MIKSVRPFLLVLSFVLPVAVFAQEDFSADIVNHKDGDNQSRARIFVTKDKWRIEGLQEGRMSGAIITNLATRTSDILMADRKMYMEFPQGQGRQPAALEFLPRTQHRRCLRRLVEATLQSGRHLPQSRLRLRQRPQRGQVHRYQLQG